MFTFKIGVSSKLSLMRVEARTGLPVEAEANDRIELARNFCLFIHSRSIYTAVCTIRWMQLNGLTPEVLDIKMDKFEHSPLDKKIDGSLIAWAVSQVGREAGLSLCSILWYQNKMCKKVPHATKEAAERAGKGLELGKSISGFWCFKCKSYHWGHNRE